MKPNQQTDAELLLRGLEPPPPPAALRLQAIAAARARMAAAQTPDLWSRVWHHNGLRLAWVAAVVFLLAGHLFMSPYPGAALKPNPSVLAGEQPDEQFLDILRPVQINAEAHPTIGRFAAADDLSQIENGGNPS